MKKTKVQADCACYDSCKERGSYGVCPAGNPAVKRDYKDSIFRMLFKEKTNLLSLYNALNATAYTDETELEITTLENAVYMNYKNDVSFVFDYELMIYEHQSTANPNMPLRDLFYVARVLQNRTRNDDLYGNKAIRIPAPKFVVFYNGTSVQPQKKILRLSDIFEKTLEEPELELKVTVYNINWGYNQEILDACCMLKEYSQYVEQVRTYAKKMPFPQAVEQAVDYCIEQGILSDFLMKNRAEAIAVCIFEYDEEKHLKSEREWAYNEGKIEGAYETLIKTIDSVMRNLNVDLRTACETLDITMEEYQQAKAQSF